MDLTNCTDATLVLTNVQTSDAGDYRVVVADATGTTNSDVASLTVMVPPGITRITNNNPLVPVGATVTMQVWVTGTAPFFIQWCQNGLPLAGKNSALLTLANVQPTNAGLYTVVVTNYVGSVTSSPVRLEVSQAPVIAYTAALQHRAVFVGAATSFAVTSSGGQPQSFQWRLDGSELLDKTNKTLSLAAVQPADEGDYTVVITNAWGAVTSEPARLWVVPPVSSFIRGNFTNAAGRGLPYFYWVPTNYVPTRSYPLFCGFHGSGDDVSVFLSRSTPERLLLASYKLQAMDPVIFVSPTRWSAGEDWTDQYLQLTSGLLDRLMSQFNIDTNRVYVDGYSQGVHAAWDLMGMRPGFFAAADVGAGWMGNALPAAIKNVPLWVACAADDEVVGVSDSRALVTALRRAGGNPIYTEYSTGGHLGGILMHVRTPATIDRFLAQRRGVASTNEPLLSITSPTQTAVYATGATSLNLAGSAAALGQPVTSVTWTNLANGAKGNASGTNAWSATGIRLPANRTNLVIVTATTTSWAPAYGGNTTFNDTLTVLQSPLGATLTLQGTSAVLNWAGGGPPYRVQRATDLVAGDWTDLLTNAVPPVPLALEGNAAFYRIIGQ
jgi:poly(3-hydroxybutyrate) depolymerase